jgi:RinA family phage transcriptional activator
MILSRATKERIIENYLKDYNSYVAGITNYERQLEYISATLVPIYSPLDIGMYRIGNNTANIALERIEGVKALEIKKEIARLQLIVESVERAVESLPERMRIFVQLRYFENSPMKVIMERLEIEEKSAYRIRRKVLDKFLISLQALVGLK